MVIKPKPKIIPPITPGSPEFIKALKNCLLYVIDKKIIITKQKNTDLQNNICHRFAPSNDFTINPPKLKVIAPKKTKIKPGTLNNIFIKFD